MQAVTLKKNKKLIVGLLLILIVSVAGFCLTRGEFRPSSESRESDITPLPSPPETSYKKVNTVLTFAVIGDIHLGANPILEKYLKEALEKAEKHGAEFVVLIGDLTQEGTLKEFQLLKKILDDSALTYYLVPGNHDTGSQAAKKGRKNFEDLFGRSYQEVVYKLTSSDTKNETKRAHLFLLDTSQVGEGGTIIDKEQWLWLKQKLDNNVKDESELRFVFTQMPFDNFGWTESHYLREFFCESFVDGAFEANAHQTNFFYRSCPIPGWKEKEEVASLYPTFKPGAIFMPDHEFPGFLIMEYFDNHFSNVKKVFVGD